MVRGKYIEGIENLTEIQALRQSVFKEELGLDALAAFDDSDAFAVHALCYDEKEAPAGIGRITFDGKRFDISHIAIRKDLRGQEYGDFVLKMLINKAAIANADTIYALSLPEQSGFFEKVGFKKTGTQQTIQGITYDDLILSGSLMHMCKGCNH